jgi:hypothetical protein
MIEIIVLTIKVIGKNLTKQVIIKLTKLRSRYFLGSIFLFIKICSARINKRLSGMPLINTSMGLTAMSPNKSPPAIKLCNETNL